MGKSKSSEISGAYAAAVMGDGLRAAVYGWLNMPKDVKPISLKQAQLVNSIPKNTVLVNPGPLGKKDKISSEEQLFDLTNEKYRNAKDLVMCLEASKRGFSVTAAVSHSGGGELIGAYNQLGSLAQLLDIKNIEEELVRVEKELKGLLDECIKMGISLDDFDLQDLDMPEYIERAAFSQHSLEVTDSSKYKEDGLHLNLP